MKHTEHAHLLPRSAGSPFRLGPLVSRSTHMKEIFDLVAELASSRPFLLIEGESGTGKRALAREIHARGPFAAGPFVIVSGVADDGTAWGEEQRHRLIAQARGGTLYVDEIAHLPARWCAELADAPEGPRRGLEDLQILAATRVDLQALVAKGLFREDLYHRLAWLPVRIPPLRTRREDIELLAEHFLARSTWRARQAPLRLGDDALAALARRSFSGNVKELEQAMERAARVARAGVVRASDLPGGEDGTTSLRDAADQTPDDRRRRIDVALARTNQHVVRAAGLLGIHPSTLYRWRRSLGHAATP